MSGSRLSAGSQAVAVLVVAGLRADVDSLVADLGAAIKEADAFIKEMDAEKAAAGTKSS